MPLLAAAYLAGVGIAFFLDRRPVEPPTVSPKLDNGGLGRTSEPLPAPSTAGSAPEALRDALARARGSGKRVWVEVYADRCAENAVWDRFYGAYPDLIEARARNFVPVRTTVGATGRDPEGLTDYLPKSRGYPAIYVLNSDGAVLNFIDRGDFTHDQFLALLSHSTE